MNTFKIEELTKWAIETTKFHLDQLSEGDPITYHTCPQVLENNILIWKSGGQWLFADSDRNRWGFSAHPRIIHVCKYCGEVLNRE